MQRVLLTTILCTIIITGHSRKYEKFALYNATPTNPDHLKFLQNLDQKKYIDIIFWKKPHKLFDEVQFVVNPADKDLLLERAQHFKLDVNLIQENIQQAFQSQDVRSYLRLRVETYTWSHYHRLVDINQWLADLALKYPQVTELRSIGKSSEGRDIFVISINRSEGKPIVIIEGGLHGNEWISTEFVLYFAYYLIVSNDTTNDRLFDLSEKYHWYLLPVCNPDGYEYSQNEDRLWRKNRRNIGNGNIGVDLNRNFDINFGKHTSNSDPKDDDYAGPMPFSEPETKAISEFISQKNANLNFYFSFHAYGQKIVIPYLDDKKFWEHDELENLGKQAIIRMFATSGVKYSIITGYGKRTAGHSAGWVKKKYDIKYVYTFYLRDNGTYGHGLPADQIEPTCEETLNGLVEIMTAKPKRVRADLFSSASRPGNLIMLCLTLLMNCLI